MGDWARRDTIRGASERAPARRHTESGHINPRVPTVPRLGSMLRMTDWLYLGSDVKGRANLTETLAAAIGRSIVWRGSRNKDGALISNVKHLKPGDTLVLAFRQPVMRGYLRARIGKPQTPARGTTAIDVVGVPYSSELQALGYPVENGTTEVIHLEDVCECCFDLAGSYATNALWRMDHNPRDAAAARVGGAIRIDHPPRRASRVARSTVGTPQLRQTKPAAPIPATERVVPPSRPLDRCFDTYVMVDWSASRVPAAANAADSIWFGVGEWQGNQFRLGKPQHHSTRSGARAWLDTHLAKWIKEKRRVLVGFDFAFGYPKGFAGALGVPNGTWADVHRLFLAVRDNAANVHDGARFAADCNRRVVPSGPGPFWGCHSTDVVPGTLTQKRVGVFTFPCGNARLDEWRLTDVRARQYAVPQTVWKLNCGVSVGMQTILGIKHLAELRRGLGGKARIWPFETGFTTPVQPEIWLSEIFPSIVATDASVVGEQPRDKRQVVSCVLEAALRDATGGMSTTLGQPSGLTQPQVDAVLGEEGWMLFL